MSESSQLMEKENKYTNHLEKENTWISYQNASIIKLLFSPFKIYLKQFPKFFIPALIVDFLFLGIFQLIIIEMGYEVTFGLFYFDLDFLNEQSARYFFPLLALGIVAIIFRSLVLVSQALQTTKEAKGNIFKAIDDALKNFIQLVIAVLVFLSFMIIPSLFAIFGVLTLYRDPIMGWTFIGISLLIPFLIGSRTILFIPTMVEEQYQTGEALQESWVITKRRNWLKTIILLVVFGLIGIYLPVALSLTLRGIMGFWGSFIGVFIRAFFYPLFDIHLAILFLNLEHESLSHAVFKEDIIKQKKKSEEIVQKKLEIEQ
jgi:membrane-anchored glycerophosphoryl diester phosphodiesterase (GDPDase)